ncbi:hypothetical protein [Roseovarius nanhaiticus]|uniref:hypothetical protein n=1 Tax=Roseovarius nanhaiticus TaxID=573024 RepID=UPI002492E635|nr:hypothetical protein [Roseovarius nanhaiticus]
MRRLTSLTRNFMCEVLPVLVALALCLRIMAAPMMVPVLVDGRIALCLGGQIVTVAVDPSDPSTPELHTDTCPLLGITAALEVTGPAFAARAVQGTEIRFAPMRMVLSESALVLSYRARAPPTVI